jgi:SPP1 gp7 family putative phage head morphogenesis protein
VLSEALLASYLLGQYQINEVSTGSGSDRVASFAEGDDQSGDKSPHSKKKKPPKGGTPNDPVQTAFDLPPAEAIDYFKAKKIVSKKVFNQLSKEAQQGAFSVSRVYKDDVLAGFKDEIDNALAEGRTQPETIKRFKSILDGAGHEQLGEFHLETVFRTNMQTAYSTGRRRALEDVADAMPWWTYHTVGDDRVRPSHRALEGITLRYDNPFWNTHFPIWDFNCRCSVTPADEIPEGYDPKHPSGDEEITLSYDEEGMPAKAEIGPTFVDLSVGKFRGIPRGASLLTTIEAGVQRGIEQRAKR